MNKSEYNEISKDEFLKLSEDDLMFITNPGRMGDVDGSTFIIKKNNELTVYRANGWMYQDGKRIDISFDDTLIQFPQWFDTWKHAKEKNNNKKYKYLYMGFGNGLCVDNSIYGEFEQYLNDLVEKFLKGKSNEEKESLKYAAIYNTWKQALVNMSDEKGYIFK